MSKIYIYIQFIVHLLTLLLVYKVVHWVKRTFVLEMNLNKQETHKMEALVETN